MTKSRREKFANGGTAWRNDAERTQPCCERYNRILLEEWARARSCRIVYDRAARLSEFVT
ncbi:hypothetical protein GCM10009648_44640 [Tsukamurella spumae]